VGFPGLSHSLPWGVLGLWLLVVGPGDSASESFGMNHWVTLILLGLSIYSISEQK